MTTAIALFLLGAGAGAFMVIRYLMKRRMPGWVAIAHGVAGAAGFAVLLLFCLREPAAVAARYALGVLIGAIVLGCVNVTYHVRGIRHRLAFIVAHALFALTGVGTLAYGAITYTSPILATPQIEATHDAPPQATVSGAPATPTPAAVAQERTTASPGAPAAATPPAAPAHHPGPAWVDQDVSFDTGRATLSPDSMSAIAAIADDMNADPSIALVEVQGHADERGSEAANIGLTRARADAIVSALVARGVAASRLRSAGYGARCPARDECRKPDAPPSCHEEDTWRQDRRVGFVILQSGGARFGGPVACDRAVDLVPAGDRAYLAGRN